MKGKAWERGIKRCQKGLGAAPRFDVRVIDDTNARCVRNFTDVKYQSLPALGPVLAHFNAHFGYSIIFRPHGPWVLIDDISTLDKVMVTRMFRVSLWVMTSPDNWQAWVYIFPRNKQLPPNLIRAAARTAVKWIKDSGGYADANAASNAQFGRMPGFTNRKPMHERKDGTYPWVNAEMFPRFAGTDTKLRRAAEAVADDDQVVVIPDDTTMTFIEAREIRTDAESVLEKTEWFSRIPDRSSRDQVVARELMWGWWIPGQGTLTPDDTSTVIMLTTPKRPGDRAYAQSIIKSALANIQQSRRRA